MLTGQNLRSGGPSGRIEAYSFVVHAQCTRFQRLIMLQHHEVNGGRLQPREEELNIGTSPTSCDPKQCSSTCLTSTKLTYLPQAAQ